MFYLNFNAICKKKNLSKKEKKIKEIKRAQFKKGQMKNVLNPDSLLNLFCSCHES